MNKPRLKKLSEQTIVITGASSGIGLTTARLVARKGARVVLSSRNEEALRRITREITDEGGQAIYVVADVADTEAVRKIADSAIEKFGSFDTWVNNAGVSIYGKLTEIPMKDKRRLFDVNFWGMVNGCRAAVPHLRERGGAIINLGSVLSDWTMPLQGIYSASKHAVKAYTESLRMELEASGAPVAITLIKPTAINTPYVQHAANHLEFEPALPPPVYAPQIVARTIAYCASHPIREINVGGAGRAMTWFEKALPRLGELYMENNMLDLQMSDRPVAGDRTKSLYQPSDEEGHESGPHEGHVMRTSIYTETVKHPLTSVFLRAAIGILLVRGLQEIRRNRARSEVSSAAGTAARTASRGTERAARDSKRTAAANSI